MRNLLKVSVRDILGHMGMKDAISTIKVETRWLILAKTKNIVSWSLDEIFPESVYYSLIYPEENDSNTFYK
jgi:hypothetical protein